jgi:RNA polymerase sigma-70 factor (ECF subfamily)
LRIHREQDEKVTLDQFLQSIEARAFRIAVLATRNEADALDLVQDAMFRLARHYRDHDPDAWRALFLKILEHRILDWQRKEKLKRALFFWRQDEAQPEDLRADENADPLEQIKETQTAAQILKGISALPLQQQQCFLLRCWEGLSVAQTAQIMGIDEGSVKTHYSRALTSLKKVYGDE